MIFDIDLKKNDWLKIVQSIFTSPEGKSVKFTLFITTMKGRRDLYRIEQAYSMFDMNVVGHLDRGTSITYTIIVGNEVAKASVMIVPDADHVNTSI